MSIAATCRSHSEAETRLMGAALGRLLRGGDVVLLDGPLGAGKTTLVRAVVEGAGLDVREVASPTFVIVHEYRRDRPCRETPDIIHVDAYRMRGEEPETIGWDSVVARVVEGMAALLIEWAERLGAPPPAEPAHIRIDHVDESQRELQMELPGAWAGREHLAELLSRQPMRCPVTGAMVAPDSPTYPFASERARLADLYRWFSGSYSISRDLKADDLEAE
jgi:tRNA threonylcarbamoyladenosine biosynthesis protein TsaE